MEARCTPAHLMSLSRNKERKNKKQKVGRQRRGRVLPTLSKCVIFHTDRSVCKKKACNFEYYFNFFVLFLNNWLTPPIHNLLNFKLMHKMANLPDELNDITTINNVIHRWACILQSTFIRRRARRTHIQT